MALIQETPKPPSELLYFIDTAWPFIGILPASRGKLCPVKVLNFCLSVCSIFSLDTNTELHWIEESGLAGLRRAICKLSPPFSGSCAVCGGGDLLQNQGLG